MRNAHGMLTRAPKEWGSKARKEEARQRGFRRRGLADSVNEGLAEMADPEVPLFPAPERWSAEAAGLDHIDNPEEF